MNVARAASRSSCTPSVPVTRRDAPAPAPYRPAASAAATTPAAGGFTVAGSRDDAFNRVGEALAGIEGATIASRAQLLGTYDVSYEGASFLVRVSAVDAGAYVSAVDPRGLPATSPAAVKLLAALKAKLGG